MGIVAIVTWVLGLYTGQRELSSQSGLSRIEGEDRGGIETRHGIRLMVRRTAMCIEWVFHLASDSANRQVTEETVTCSRGNNRPHQNYHYLTKKDNDIELIAWKT